VTANNLAPAGAEGLDHDFVAGKSSSPRWGGFPGRVDQSQGFAKSAHPWLSSFGSSGAFNARVFNLHRVAGGNTIMEHYPRFAPKFARDGHDGGPSPSQAGAPGP